MNKISSSSDYLHDEQAPHTSSYLEKPILDILKKIGAKKILDVGCGNGSLSYTLHKNGYDVIGIDSSESGIINSRKILPNNKFYCASIYDSPELVEESEFDAVVATEVVEHLFYPRELPRFIDKKLKPGGHCLLTTPYHGYLKNLTLSIANKWDFHHSPLWDGGHIKFWSRKSLSQLLEETGFECVKFVGCGRAPYLWKSMLLLAQKKAI